MALAYVQPGVTVIEQVSPLTAPFLTSPTSLCLVGMSQGLLNAKDTFTLTGTQVVGLPSAPQTATMTTPGSIVSVTDASSAATYAPSDYTFAVISVPQTTTVNATIAPTDTTLTVVSTTGFPTAGVILIDNEQIYYASVTGTTFAGCIRGYAGSVPAAHTVGTTIAQAKYTLVRTGGSTIPSNNSVTVRYTYTPANYFNATRFDNLGAIQDFYGPALDSNNNILNDLTFASQVAFENGASSLVCQPLFYMNGGVPTQPIPGSSSATTGSWANAATWTDTLQNSLRSIEDINVIIPIIGQSKTNVGDADQGNVFNTVQDHLAYMNTQQQYIVALFGEDSSASSAVATDSTLINRAGTIQSRQGGLLNQQIALVSPSKYSRQLPSSIRNFFLGGQYMAAALGGMLAARPTSQALTRQIVSGFNGVALAQTKAQKNADAQAGLLVIEAKGQQSVQVRHSITVDQTGTATRELSVVRAKYRMTSSVRATLENNVIGKVVADGNAPTLVANQVAAVLEALKGQGDLVDYKGIQARTLQLDPTTVEVRFSYKPAFPLNYVNVIFSLDLTSGNVQGL